MGVSSTMLSLSLYYSNYFFIFTSSFFNFSTIFTLDSFTTTSIKLQIYSFFINFWFSLPFSILIFQSGFLLKLSISPIFVPSTYFKMKSNLNKYNIYLVCLQFNFYTFIKYSKFLWFIQTLNLNFVPSNKYL